MKITDVCVDGWTTVAAKNWAMFTFAICRHIVFGLLLLLCIGFLISNGMEPTDLFCQFMHEIDINNTGSIFNVVSLFFIVGLSIANVKREWQESLPKFLSVRYFCNGQELPELADDYAPLISEADIRPLAQQIGQQKNNNCRLDLDSTDYNFEKTICYDRIEKAFWHYVVKVSLKTPPVCGKQFLSEQEYLGAINHNLAELLKMKEIDYETQFVKELRTVLAEFKTTQS